MHDIYNSKMKTTSKKKKKIMVLKSHIIKLQRKNEDLSFIIFI
jgi:hypothetical protein